MTEVSPARPAFDVRRAAPIFWGVLLVCALAFLLRVLLQPDPDGRLIWARAQRLEASNLIRPALRQYDLLADNYSGSRYARLALQREGEILTDLARAGATSRYAQALAVYARLARDYPLTDGADARLAIGEIQLDDLKNFAAARTTYADLMRDFPGKRDIVAQSMLALGQVAVAARDGKGAQRWFQKVLQTYPEQPENCAEAQFRLGETYETIWRNKDWARDAYDATIQKYPETAWAGRARTSLGLLVYGEMVPNARRVLIKTSGAFDGGAQDERDSLLNALKVVLGTRGLEADSAMLRGWSQTPFVGAFDPKNPGRAAAPTLNAFENAVAASGMTYSVSDGGDSNSARRNLQNEIDTAHLTLVYTGQWQFVAGYDSRENMVFLQSGARVQPVRVLDFLKSWGVRSPLGGSYTLISFSTGADDLRADQSSLALPVDRILFTRVKTGSSATAPNPRNAILPNPLATQKNPIPIGTQMSQTPLGLMAPTWVFTPPSLDEKAVYRRAVRNAASWMERARSGETLLNGAALQTLADELRRAAQSSISPTPPDATPALEEPLARRNEETAASANAANTANSIVPNTSASPAAAPFASPTLSPGTSPSSAISSTRMSTRNGTNTGNIAAPAPVLAPKTLGKTSVLPPISAAERVRRLLPWRGAPLSQWLDARRDAIGFLNGTGDKLRAPALKQAAQNFNLSIANLQNARAALDELASLDANGTLLESGVLSANAREILLQAATEIEAARRQENQATALMSQI